LEGEGGEEGGDDFEGVAAGTGEPAFVGAGEQGGDLVVLVVAFLIGGVCRAAAIGKGGEAGGFQQLHHQRGAGTRQAGDEGDEVFRGHAGKSLRPWLELGHRAVFRIVTTVQRAGAELLDFGKLRLPQRDELLAGMA
jgi:hypothetical protein